MDALPLLGHNRGMRSMPWRKVSIRYPYLWPSTAHQVVQSSNQQFGQSLLLSIDGRQLSRQYGSKILDGNGL